MHQSHRPRRRGGEQDIHGHDDVAGRRCGSAPRLQCCLEEYDATGSLASGLTAKTVSASDPASETWAAISNIVVDELRERMANGAAAR